MRFLRTLVGACVGVAFAFRPACLSGAGTAAFALMLGVVDFDDLAPVFFGRGLLGFRGESGGGVSVSSTSQLGGRATLLLTVFDT